MASVFESHPEPMAVALGRIVLFSALPHVVTFYSGVQGSAGFQPAHARVVSASFHSQLGGRQDGGATPEVAPASGRPDRSIAHP
jgi:hypothetical protein